jgi:leucine dehydrogenase
MTHAVVEHTAAPVPIDGLDHEEVVVRRGARSGAQLVVAIHSTALGPALGGARMWCYDSHLDGLRDALRLARAMTYKAAAAGLDLGGGKGVICTDSGPHPAGEERRRLLLDFGDLVESLEGRYITAEDIGTGAADIEVMAERTTHLTGLPMERGGSGDPSPLTALGVEAAMRACARRRLGSADLGGLHVCVIGLGHVGSQLARRLSAAGAVLSVTDVDSSKHELAHELGAAWLDPADAMLADCDVLAPCALGGAIDREVAARLRCAVVCGSANNVLADEELDGEIAARGILYAPDFIANAGGLINVYREIKGYGANRARDLVLGIENTMERTLSEAERSSVTPLDAAYELARRRLDRARGGRNGNRSGALEAAVG